MNAKEKQLDQTLFEVAHDQERSGEAIVRRSFSFWEETWMRLKENKGALGGMIMIIVIVFFAFMGPVMSGRDANAQNITHAKLDPKIPVIENFIPFFDGVDAKG
ncbi:MAG: ABC transporter permease, partial [Bacilli bacterium]